MRAEVHLTGGRAMAEETRRATGRWERSGAGAPASGEGPLEISDDGVTAGPVAVEFLDADTLTEADRVLTLDLFPEGSLRLSMLARRHETFAAALGEARDRARLAGLLAHGVTAPETFAGALRADGREARFLVYATHVAVVPKTGDPFQIPFGDVTAVSFEAAAWAVVLQTSAGPVAFGQLARQTDAFHRAVAGARDAQARRLEAIAGSSAFADGRGVAAEAALPGFDRLLDAWTAPERAECAAAILAAADRKATRIGLVELLDPDGEALAAKTPLPENVAAFLLAEVAGKVVLEILSGPRAATYVFKGDVEAVNRDLQQHHFRRRPLALSEKDAAGEAGR
ncbi:MAG: hypothetical protein ACXVH0_00900, partial [Thermoanaerobaculia bacterium]